MTNQISTFNFKSNPVRIETIKSEPYFCLTDVCTVLNIRNANASRFNFNSDGIHKMYSVDTLNRKNELTFINEPNLYRVIFRSNKAEAVEFQNWVFEEVLPQIRKTGSYSQNVEEIRPLERTLNLELPESDVLSLASLWFALYKCRETLDKVAEPLSALGSRLGATAYTQATEYRNILNMSKTILEPILDGIQPTDGHFSLALNTLRTHQVKRNTRLAVR